MPERSKSETAVQAELPFSKPEESSAQQIDDSRRRAAFGSFVKEHQYDPEGKLSSIELTETEKDWLTAEKLTELVFVGDVKPKRSFDSNPVGFVRGVLLPPRELTWVKRPPELLARSVARTTLSAAVEIDDEAQDRSVRSRAHTLESTIGIIHTHRNGLIERRQDITVLIKEAKTAGFAHKSAEEMKRLIGQSWSELLNILDTLKIHRGWNDQTRMRAEAAAVHYLTSKGQNVRVGNWQRTLSLEDSYLKARISLLGVAHKAHQQELDKTVLEHTEVDDSKLE